MELVFAVGYQTFASKFAKAFPLRPQVSRARRPERLTSPGCAGNAVPSSASAYRSGITGGRRISMPPRHSSHLPILAALRPKPSQLSPTEKERLGN